MWTNPRQIPFESGLNELFTREFAADAVRHKGLCLEDQEDALPPATLVAKFELQLPVGALLIVDRHRISPGRMLNAVNYRAGPGFANGTWAAAGGG